MTYESLDDYLGAIDAGPSGPRAIILCESEFLAAETAQRLVDLRFQQIIAIGPGARAAEGVEQVAAIMEPIGKDVARAAAVNRLIADAPARWTLLLFNGEFVFYPFCETRSIRDFAEFLNNERRPAAMGYAIDLYSDALGQDDAAFSPQEAYFDAEGWYGFERGDKIAEIYGGVGWRFEEFMPHTMLRVNRPALFWADPEVPIRGDLWFDEDAYNAVSCPWHNNPTFALMSVRRAMALRAHPNFAKAVKTLMWPCSQKFEWRSEQLLSLGMIEAGQWL